jgi:Cu-Zn family superoxide dismutase
MRKLLVAVAIVVGLGAAGAGVASRLDASTFRATAVLRDAAGAEVGQVWFVGHDDHTIVRVRVEVAEGATDVDAFHGFHVHANDDPANGEGCVADPGAAPNTWFTSADGHWKEAGQDHADHLGDMPSLLLDARGVAEARFRTTRFEPGELADRAVIVHAGPDNFGNVPLGTAPNQYSANSDAARQATANTGNAGDRFACGLVELSG